jgi:hypothetical protein
VPPAIHKLHPRIAAVYIEPAQVDNAGAGWAASAAVVDGVERYTVTVKLGTAGGRWVVVALLPGA